MGAGGRRIYGFGHQVSDELARSAIEAEHHRAVRKPGAGGLGGGHVGERK
jgi:hypothetical protein